MNAMVRLLVCNSSTVLAIVKASYFSAYAEIALSWILGRLTIFINEGHSNQIQPAVNAMV